MAVLIEAISVVVRKKTITEKYPGGLAQYIEDCPNKTLCTDDEITSVRFMTGRDADVFIKNLKRHGFRLTTEHYEYDEIAVVDQSTGFYAPCDWLDFTDSAGGIGVERVSACKIKGASCERISVPEDWVYEESLSRHAISDDEDELKARTIFLRREGNCDIFLDKRTGLEGYIERSAKRILNS